MQGFFKDFSWEWAVKRYQIVSLVDNKQNRSQFLHNFNLQMNLKLILFLAVVTLALSKPFQLAATPSPITSRAHLLHSKVALDYFKLHNTVRLRRHRLETFEQVPLQTDHYGFTLALKVGGVDYKMSMDTGSSDVYIKGEKDAPGVPKKRYISGEDYKSKPIIRIGYLDGDMKTYEAVLPAEFDNKKFDLPLLVAYTAPPQFETVQGLIGLSYPEIARHQPTFIQTLIKNKIIKNYAYGMNLNLIQANRSFVTFGQKDPNLYEGRMIEYPIGHSKEIKIAFNSIRIGQGKELKIKQALLDTGNTCISIPHAFEEEILSNFNTANNKCIFEVEDNVPMFSLLVCKIGNYDELPVLTLNIGGNEYQIEKQFYIQRCTQNPKESPQKTYYCDTYIESTKYGPNMIFLGDGFFNRFYTFFDLQNQKVGIARNRENITFADIKKQEYKYDAKDWEKLNGERSQGYGDYGYGGGKGGEGFGWLF